MGNAVVHCLYEGKKEQKKKERTLWVRCVWLWSWQIGITRIVWKTVLVHSCIQFQLPFAPTTTTTMCDTTHSGFGRGETIFFSFCALAWIPEYITCCRTRRILSDVDIGQHSAQSALVHMPDKNRSIVGIKSSNTKLPICVQFKWGRGEEEKETKIRWNCLSLKQNNLIVTCCVGRLQDAILHRLKY